tara:strand:+ start:373 stop:882 length:510 start_codon:yes stop_codon:yes gene_type:complete
VEKSEKLEFVQNLRSNLESAAVLVLTQPSGLTVSEVTDLRQKMREAGASYKVVKNTLAKIALQDTPFSGVVDQIKGPVALAYSSDPVSAAKVAVKYAKGNDKFAVLAGAMTNTVMSKSQVEALSELPSLDELRAKLMAVITTPAQQIASVLSAPGRQIAQVVSAYSQKS